MSFTIPSETITPPAITPASITLPPVQPPIVLPPAVQSKSHLVDWSQDSDGTVHILVDGVEVGKVPPIGTPAPVPPPAPVVASVKQARYAQGNEYPLPNTARRKLIIFQGPWHTADVTAFKQANPSGIALCYVNLMYDSVWNISPMGSTILSRSQAQALGADTGIAHSSWQWLCNIGKAGYASQAIQNINANVFNFAAWDGVFLDDCNPGWFAENANLSSMGYSSMSDWATRAVIPTVDAIWQNNKAKGKLTVANMNGSWGQYRSQCSQVLDHLDGGLDEFYGTWPAGQQLPIAYTRNSLANVDDCVGKGKIHFACTQLASGTDSQRALYGYCLALVATGSDKCYFNAHFDSADLWIPQFDQDIGAPTGPRTEVSTGVFQRQFTKATVTANQNTLTGSIA